METFSSGQHTIYHGDALSVLASDRILDASIDLIFADPPYNIGKNFNGRPDKWPSEEAYWQRILPTTGWLAAWAMSDESTNARRISMTVPFHQGSSIRPGDSSLKLLYIKLNRKPCGISTPRTSSTSCHC